MNCNICNKNICKHCLLGGKLKLDSLQRFTTNFSFYDKSPIDFSKYRKYNWNFAIEDVYKK